MDRPEQHTARRPDDARRTVGVGRGAPDVVDRERAEAWRPVTVRELDGGVLAIAVGTGHHPLGLRAQRVGPRSRDRATLGG